MTELTIIDDLPQSLLENDPEVTLPATADRAARMVDWWGLLEMIKDPKLAKALEREKLRPKEGEQAHHYIARIWPLLEANERGLALDHGLHKMVQMSRIAEVGIQVRVWRAYQSGDWECGPGQFNDFRAWVRSVLVDSLSGSGSEATQLAHVCEAVMWLSGELLEGIELPDDLESIFRRPLYRRWRSVAGKITAHIKELEEADAAYGDEIAQEIVSLVEAAQDEEMSQEERDARGRKRGNPRIPPIVVTELPKRDELGRYLISAAITEGQKAHFLRKLGDSIDYRLTGEVYDTLNWQYVEYREHTRWFCTECGMEWEYRPDRGPNCVGCGIESPNLVQAQTYAVRTWDDKDGWSDYHKSDVEPVPEGHLDRIHEDPEMGLKYMWYWEAPVDAAEQD